MLERFELRHVVRRDGTLTAVKVPTAEFLEALGDASFRSDCEIAIFRTCRVIVFSEPTFDRSGRLSAERITCASLGFRVSPQIVTERRLVRERVIRDTEARCEERVFWNFPHSAETDVSGVTRRHLTPQTNRINSEQS